MSDTADPKTLMDQAAPTALHYMKHIENELLENPEYETLRAEHPAAYYGLVGDLVRAASNDYAGAIIARAIELRSDAE